MPHRIDFAFAAECTPEVGQCVIERNQSVSHLLLAGRIPFRYFKFPLTFLADLDRVLNGMDLFDVIRARWINQSAHGCEYVASADLALGQCAAT
jgi:hypothetical protein